jgi:hypothetical protein
MKNKILFTLLTTSATLMVTHPTININFMPDAIIYTKASSINDKNYCQLQNSFTNEKGLQVCEYKCSVAASQKGEKKSIYTTSFNNARVCRPQIEAP